MPLCPGCRQQCKRQALRDYRGVGSETVGSFELVAKLRSLQVFAEVGEPLFQREERLSDSSVLVWATSRHME